MGAEPFGTRTSARTVERSGTPNGSAVSSIGVIASRRGVTCVAAMATLIATRGAVTPAVNTWVARSQQVVSGRWSPIATPPPVNGSSAV
jgi:hypothetical protein